MWLNPVSPHSLSWYFALHSLPVQLSPFNNPLSQSPRLSTRQTLFKVPSSKQPPAASSPIALSACPSVLSSYPFPNPQLQPGHTGVQVHLCTFGLNAGRRLLIEDPTELRRLGAKDDSISSVLSDFNSDIWK